MSHRVPAAVQADIAQRAAVALARCAEIVAQHPEAQAIASGPPKRGERTGAGAQDRLGEAVRFLEDRRATAAWRATCGLWWQLALTEDGIARRHRWRIPGMAPEDVLNEARIGLYEGARRWRPGGGAHFAHYARPWVRARLYKLIEHSRAIRFSAEISLAVARVRRDPSLTAADLGVCAENLRAAMVADQVVSLDLVSDEGVRLGDSLSGSSPSPEGPTSARVLLDRALADASDAVLAALDLRLAGYERVDVMRELGVSRSRVDQLDRTVASRVRFHVEGPAEVAEVVSNGARTAQQIAKRLSVPLVEATRMLRTAEQQGLVRRAVGGFEGVRLVQRAEVA